MNKKVSHYIIAGIATLSVLYAIYQSINPPPLRQSSEVPGHTNQKVESGRPSVDQYPINTVLSDYKNNEVNAEQKYMGKIVKTSGYIAEIKRNAARQMFLVIGPDKTPSSPAFHAFFDEIYKTQIAGLRNGDNVTVVCRIQGISINVIGNSCHLIINQ